MPSKMTASEYNNPLSTSIRAGGFKSIGPAHRLALGGEAPEFTLADLDGKQMTLSYFRGKSYVVLEFGSIT